MRYVPLCLMMSASFYLFINNIDGWGWGIILSFILASAAYGK